MLLFSVADFKRFIAVRRGPRQPHKDTFKRMAMDGVTEGYRENNYPGSLGRLKYIYMHCTQFETPPS